MVFNQEDKVLIIKVLLQEWGYQVRKFKFPNRNWSVSFSKKLLKKIDHTMNEAAVLENLYFQRCNLKCVFLQTSLC